MAFLAGIHFWWPKMTGRMYPEKISQLAAVVTFIGFVFTFFRSSFWVFWACRGATRRIRRSFRF